MGGTRGLAGSSRLIPHLVGYASRMGEPRARPVSSQASVPIGNGRGRRSVRLTCRRYTSVFLVFVGVLVAAALVVFDVWWGLAAAVLIAFLFGAVIARPWCAGTNAHD